MWPPLPQVPSEAGVRHPCQGGQTHKGSYESQALAELELPSSLPRPAIPRRPGQRVPGLRDCPLPWGWCGPQLCGSVWLHFEWMLLLQELRTETRGTSTPQQVAPSLCHLPENEGITELSRTVPNPGLRFALRATWGSVLPAKCLQEECTQFHRGTRLLPLAWAQPSCRRTRKSLFSATVGGWALEP